MLCSRGRVNEDQCHDSGAIGSQRVLTGLLSIVEGVAGRGEEKVRQALEIGTIIESYPNDEPYLIGIRHRLIHEYFRVDLRVVWETVQRDLPRLIALIEPLVPLEDDV
jgi:hypothetical protein